MKLHYLIFVVILFSSFNSNKLIKRKGFLFFIDNQIEGFFIESKDSVLSYNVFSNPSYMVIDRLCTRSPGMNYFRNSTIGRKIKFEYIIAYGDTLKKTEVNFIYCDLDLKVLTRRTKAKEKITGKFDGRMINTVNQVFNNQIEYLFPADRNEGQILIHEIGKK